MRRKLFFDSFCLALIILGILVFFHKGLQGQGIFFGADEVASDLVNFSYPYREYWADEYLKAGQVPLWNQYLASGLPFLAEAQTGVFYPVAVILYRLLSPAAAFNWLIISSFIIAGVGSYLYARKAGLGPGYALFSALVFVFSGSMVARVRHVPIITAVAFMPFIFWTTENILTGGKTIWAVLLAIFVSFSFFAGHLTTTYAILLILTAYFLTRLWLITRDSGKENAQAIVLFVSGVVLAILLSAVQLAPSLELIQYSTRNESDFQLLTLPYNLQHLIFFIAPYALGDPSRGTWSMGGGNFWENIGYIGILPLVLAIGGLLVGSKKRNRVIQASSVVTILSLLLVVGQNTPLYGIAWGWIPGFSFTRLPGRFLLFTDFFASLLAGWGLFYLGRKALPPVVLVLSLADLWFFGFDFNVIMPLAYLAPPKSVQFLQKDNDLFRVRPLEDNEASWGKAWRLAAGWRGSLVPYLRQRENLPGDLSLLYRLQTPSLIYALNGHFSPLRPNVLDDAATIALFKDRPLGARVFGMMGVKYLTSAEKFIPGDDLSLVYQGEDGEFPAYIYENKRVLPRAFIVGRGEYLPSDQKILERLFSADFEPRKEILLEKEVKTAGGCLGGEATIRNYEGARVAVDTKSAGNCFLFLADTYYPGWEATIDGKPTEIFLANYTYRAIVVPSGTHKVEFKYDPISVRLGGWVSAGAGVALVLLLAVAIYKRR